MKQLLRRNCVRRFTVLILATVIVAIGSHNGRAEKTEGSVKPSEQAVPRVDVHKLIERRPLLVTGDAVENALLEKYKNLYHRGIIRLYNLRNHAPWAKPGTPGIPGVWDGAEPKDPDYRNASAEAVERYRDMKFGVRIIFGLFQHHSRDGRSGRHSWEAWYVNKGNGKYTKGEKECEDFLKRYFTTWQDFNPVNFNGDEWGSLFKEAGFKFAVLTTKNHDGFCIWPTKTRVHALKHISGEGDEPKYTTVFNHFSIEDTPYKRDFLKEYADGLRKHGLAVGFYFSNPDWMDCDARFAAGNIFR